MMREIAAGLALVMGSAAQAAAPGSAEQAVDTFHSALAKGDTTAAAALLADDALIFEEGEAERSKADYAAHHLPADAAFAQAVGSTVTRRSADTNGNLAWIASEGQLTGTWKGKTVARTTTETMLLRRIDGNWRIVHVHWSAR
jgi:ketosteroid isomerase-like protein